MENRKILKKRAKKNLKSHYFTFLILCLVLSFFGVRYAGTLTSVQYQYEEDTGKETSSSSSGLFKVYDDLVNNNKESGEKEAAKLEKNYKKQDKGALARSKGAFAGLVNSVTSGSILIKFVNTLSSVTDSESVVIFILIVIAFILQSLWWIFFQNVMSVVAIRMFLESRIYEYAPIRRIFHIRDSRNWFNTAKTMLLKSIFESLWAITIVGGVIKYYSYYLVDYIIAENPSIKPIDAINLSRKMMNGYKWECFKIDFSFIGWEILKILTFGISGVFFSNPYHMATMCEFYAGLRKHLKTTGANQIENLDLLNDQYLYEKADKTLLEKTYPEGLIEPKENPYEKEKHQGIKGFFAYYLGVASASDEQEKEWQKNQEEKLVINDAKPACQALIYPSRLSGLGQREKLGLVRPESLYYVRHYSAYSLLIIFFALSFIGWLWEVSLHLILDGQFINRGVMIGPWLPIYGFGGVFVLVLLNRFRENPAKEFVAAIILSGVLEYFTSFILQVAYGQRWWDYTGYLLNLNGRICAEGLLVFGLGSMAVVYLIAPRIDDKIRKIRPSKLRLICLILLGLFLTDAIHSTFSPNVGKGITDY